MITGRDYAELLNSRGIGSMSLRRGMKNFWIHWAYESDEWRMEFVKSVKPEIMVYIMNHPNEQ